MNKNTRSANDVPFSTMAPIRESSHGTETPQPEPVAPTQLAQPTRMKSTATQQCFKAARPMSPSPICDNLYPSTLDTYHYF
jgi:hypothetical protein